MEISDLLLKGQQQLQQLPGNSAAEPVPEKQMSAAQQIALSAQLGGTLGQHRAKAGEMDD